MNICHDVKDSEVLKFYRNRVYLLVEEDKLGKAYIEIDYCPFCGLKFKGEK